MHLASPLIGLLINTFIHIITYRYKKKLGLLKTLLIGFIGGFFTVLVIEIVYQIPTKLTTMEIAAQSSLNIISFIALGYCYFHFCNLGETGRRIHIIREIWDNNNSLSMNNLLESYNAKTIIHARLQRMINSKQIFYQDNKYFTKNSPMLYMAKSMALLKSVLFKRT